MTNAYVLPGYWSPGYCVGDMFPKMPAVVNASVSTLTAISTTTVAAGLSVVSNHYVCTHINTGASLVEE